MEYSAFEIEAMKDQCDKLELMKFIVNLCLNVALGSGKINLENLKPWDIKLNYSELERKGFLASTMRIDTGEIIILVKPEIAISKILSTLAHETIHLMQYLKGDAEIRAGKFYWKGVKFDVLPGHHPDHLEYDSQPWEEEAFRLAPELEQIVRQRLTKILASV